MGKLVREMGRGGRLMAMAVAGVIALGGIGTAAVMMSCEAYARALRGPGSGDGGVQTTGRDTSVPRAGGSSAPVNRVPGEPEIRVRILSGVESVRIACAAGVLVGQGEPRGFVALPPGAKTDPRGSVLTITSRGGQWMLADAAGAPVAVYATGSSLVLLAANDAQMLTIGTTLYPGSIRLTARSEVRDGAFDVVSFVGLEEYLPGVVAKEMLAGWPRAAYEAQAVAARTYAMQERERGIRAGSTMGFDVESNDRDQVYGGATTNVAAREAARSTRGMVLMDGEHLLRAYYSSTCGGRTAAAKDTWPSGPGFEFNLAGPIQEHHREAVCQGSPLYRWTQERTRAELAQRLRWFGERQNFAVRKIREVGVIEVMTVNGDGRPSRYKICEPVTMGGAWYQLSAEEIRLACNANGPAGAAPSAADAGAVGGAASGLIADIDRRSRVHSSDFEVAVRGDRVVFSGRGFGHGVGMCQYCAKGFAERGENWQTMIARFYPGARIVKQY